MTPYVISTGDIPEELVEKFRRMRGTFESLPDFEGEVITCHAICTAFAKHYNLTCVDGYFGTGNQHSWIIDQRYPKIVLDMYPVAGATSLMVYRHWALPWDKLYISKEIDYDKVPHERQVAKILSAIKRNEHVEKN